MPSARDIFNSNMALANEAGSVYDFLKGAVGGPVNYDDILRFWIVNSVSAIDKLVHDLVRNGMVEIFSGLRTPTPKYLAEPVALSLVNQLMSSQTPPAVVVFEQSIRAKLKVLTFQDPDKVADGLSYIWGEGQKWQKIAAAIGMEDQPARVKLKLIVSRRNAIVHEADQDPITHEKLSISRAECADVADFLQKVGNAICDLVA